MEGKYPAKRCLIVHTYTSTYQIYTFAWLFGFTISVLTYYVICQYISPLGDALVDEAVLPSQPDDVTTDEDSYETKGGLQAHTREVHGF